MKRLLPAALALLLTLPGPALASEGEFVQDHWTTRQGLPQNSVTAIGQDSHGFIWLTTYGGLVRFDGRSFHTLNSGNTPGLNAARFLSLAIDAQDSIYAGSEGQGLFVIRNGSATRMGPEQLVWDIKIDAQGVVWVAGAQQSLRISEGEVQPLDISASLFNIFTDGDDVAGLGLDGAVTCLSGACEQLPPQGPAEPGLQTWLRASNGELLSTCPLGVFAWDGQRWQPRMSSENHDMPRPLLCTPWREETWCGQDSRPEPLGQQAVLLGPTQSKEISALFVDREQGLWVGTDGDGVLRLEPITALSVGSDRSSFDVVEAPIGSISYGYFRAIQGILGLEPPFPKDTQGFWQEDEGVALAVTDAELLRLSERGLERLGPLPQPRLPVITPVRGPWFSQGASLYSATELGYRLQATPLELQAETVRPVRGDQDGAWVVLDEDRLVYWSQGEARRVIPLQENQHLRDLKVSGPDLLWLATYGSGLLAVSGERVVGQLTHAQGGCDDMVSHIYALPDEHLWFNTNRGLGRVEESSILPAMRGEGLTNCTLVGSNEGNGAKGIVDSQGNIWAPTISGMAMLDPERVPDSGSPELLLQSVHYGDADLLAGESAIGMDSLQVRYVGLYFQHPHAVHYRYRLLGLQEAWSQSSTNQELHYHNLQPGDYVLQVQARGLGDWSDPVELSFNRAPTFWERPAARYGLPLGGIALIIGSLASGLAYARRRSEVLKKEVARRVMLQSELEQQQAQNTRIQAQIEATRRLDSIGRLSAGIAHDFNNLFTVVSIHAAMLAEHSDPAVQEDAQSLMEVVESGVGVARGLMVFGRRQGAKDGRADLGQRTREILPLLRRLIRVDLALDLQAQPGCVVPMDPGQVDQVVTNLVLNARDATQGPGEIHILVTRDQDWVTLQVQDHGIGMSPEQLAQALEPYFTSKPLERGTGLGLSTVHGLMRDAGGEVELRSELGQGTTVLLRFPLAELPQQRQRPEPSAEELGPISVLLVEDRPPVREGLLRLIEHMGCSARAVATLKEAEQALRLAPVDLVVSDVVMPHGNGPQVRDALRRISPGLPVLFISGYAGAEFSGLQAQDIVLAKPFGSEELRAAMLRALTHS